MQTLTNLNILALNNKQKVNLSFKNFGLTYKTKPLFEKINFSRHVLKDAIFYALEGRTDSCEELGDILMNNQDISCELIDLIEEKELKNAAEFKEAARFIRINLAQNLSFNRNKDHISFNSPRIETILDLYAELLDFYYNLENKTSNETLYSRLALLADMDMMSFSKEKRHKLFLRMNGVLFSGVLNHDRLDFLLDPISEHLNLYVFHNYIDLDYIKLTCKWLEDHKEDKIYSAVSSIVFSDNLEEQTLDFPFFEQIEALLPSCSSTMECLILDFIKSSYDEIINGKLQSRLIDGIQNNLFEERPNSLRAYLAGLPVSLEVSPRHFEFLMNVKKISKGLFKKLVNEPESIEKLDFSGSIPLLTKMNTMFPIGQLTSDELNCFEKIKMSFLSSSKRNNLTIKENLDALCEEKLSLSFKEVYYILFNLNSCYYNKLHLFQSLKCEARLLRWKEMVFIQKHRGIAAYEDYISLLKEKRLDELMNQSNPFNLSKDDYIDWLYLTKQGYQLKDATHLKAVLMLLHENIELIKDLKETASVRDLMVHFNRSKKINDFLKHMKLSDEFKEKYLEGLIDFYVSPNFEITYAAFNNRSIDKNSLRLICKAVIAKKYEEVKFNHVDLCQEVATNVPVTLYDKWIENTSFKEGDLRIEEASDYHTILCLGELPTYTCMNYRDGSYSKCLLSNFDSNKKIIKIYYRNEYIGRAILRFTKMRHANASSKNTLAFRDIEAPQENEINEVPLNEEQFVIFVERIYTSLDSVLANKAKKLMARMLNMKARDMGISLAFCKEYHFDFGLKSTNEFFISASKNGLQYLDSFDGSTSSAYFYKETSVTLV